MFKLTLRTPLRQPLLGLRPTLQTTRLLSTTPRLLTTTPPTTPQPTTVEPPLYTESQWSSEQKTKTTWIRSFYFQFIMFLGAGAAYSYEQRKNTKLVEWKEDAEEYIRQLEAQVRQSGGSKPLFRRGVGKKGAPTLEQLVKEGKVEVFGGRDEDC